MPVQSLGFGEKIAISQTGLLMTHWIGNNGFFFNYVADAVHFTADFSSHTDKGTFSFQSNTVLLKNGLVWNGKIW